MTKTALRALTVAALSAAITLTIASPALADTSGPCAPGQDVSTPECPNPWPDTTNVTVCMTDPALCEPEASQPAPAPVVDTPAARTSAAPTAAPAKGQQFQAPLADGHVTGAPAAAPTSPTSTVAAVPFWVLLDKVMEILRAAFGPLFSH